MPFCDKCGKLISAKKWDRHLNERCKDPRFETRKNWKGQTVTKFKGTRT